MTSSSADSQLIEGNGDLGIKRPVWNVPSTNGTTELTSVVDTVSWPPLSESTKSSSDSLKSLSDSLSMPSSSNKASTYKSGSNPNQFTDHAENSMSSTHHNHASQQMLTVPEVSSRCAASGNNEQHQSHTNPSRKGGNNGGGSHQNHGYREWNRNRNNHHMQRGFRTYFRPQNFMGPTPMPRPIAGNAMGYAGFPPLYYMAPQQYPEPIRGMPFVPYPIPHAMFIPPFDPQRAALLKQIEYYFSSENLVKDLYLRSHMDELGWVPITLIAGFQRVKDLTNNIPYILDTLRYSPLIEVQGEKIRIRNDWMMWMLPKRDRAGAAFSQPFSKPSTDINDVAVQLQQASIDGAAPNSSANHNRRTDVVFTRSASGNLNNQISVVSESDGVGNSQFTGSQDCRSLPRCDTL